MTEKQTGNAEPALDLLDPKNDYVFKRLFVRAPRLLVALINAVRHAEAPIRAVRIRNSGLEGEERGDKAVVLDILAADERGRLYNVEMQIRQLPAWSARSLYYLAKLLSQELKAGQDYSEAKPVIAIHLVDFELFTADDPQQGQAHWHFEFRDRRQPAVRLGDQLELHLIELPKADRLGLAAHQEADLAAWVSFLKHWQDEGRMSSLNSPAVDEAMQELKRISADEDERYRALARERALSDAVTDRNAARREGLEEGKLEGEAAVLERLLTRRFGPLDETTRSRIRGAGLEQLERWTDRILDAPTLTAVFEEH